MKKSLYILMILATCISTVRAQDAKVDKQNARAAEVKRMVDEKRYIFRAEWVIPISGRIRQLTSDYDVRVLKDTIIAFLPYFGRAYSAPISSDGGFKFTSTDFEYTVQKRKKHGWDILISPKDAKEATQLIFTIFDDGTASLKVNSSNRQPISFNGYIIGIKPK